jgi:hypothetical protein
VNSGWPFSHWPHDQLCEICLQCMTFNECFLGYTTTVCDSLSPTLSFSLISCTQEGAVACSCQVLCEHPYL